MNQALGLIETVGKVAAVTAMDAAVKAADITLISLENSRGQGRMCAKFVGEVSAVKAAAEAGVEAVKTIGCDVYAYKVIPRPSEQLDDLMRATMGRSYLESWHPNKEVIEEVEIKKAEADIEEIRPLVEEAKLIQEDTKETTVIPTEKDEKKGENVDSNSTMTKSKKVNNQTKTKTKK